MNHEQAFELWLAIVNLADIKAELFAEGASEFGDSASLFQVEKDYATALEYTQKLFTKITGFKPTQMIHDGRVKYTTDDDPWTVRRIDTREQKE